MKHRGLILVGICFGLLFFLGGCGNDNQANLSTIKAGALSGKIGGKEWRFAQGTAVQAMSRRSDGVVGPAVWVITLHDQTVDGDPCKSSSLKAGQTGYDAHFFVRGLKAGELDYSTGSGKGAVSLNVTTKSTTGISSDGVGAFGKGNITLVAQDRVEGNLNVKGDDNNFLNGTFSAKLCR